MIVWGSVSHGDAPGDEHNLSNGLDHDGVDDCAYWAIGRGVGV